MGTWEPTDIIEITARLLNSSDLGKLPPERQAGTLRLSDDDASWTCLTADLHLRFLLSDIVGASSDVKFCTLLAFTL